MMTLRRVQTLVAHVARMAGDDELAHGAEDNLHHRVLRAIADGKCDDPQACAAAALATLQLDLCKVVRLMRAQWYAELIAAGRDPVIIIEQAQREALEHAACLADSYVDTHGYDRHFMPQSLAREIRHAKDHI